jgi:DNA polymerase elongation subunit (family B)
MTEPRILLWDIETAPNLGYTWGKWEQNVLAFESEWYLLTISWKWLGEKTTHVTGLVDFEKRYKKNPEDDYELAKLAWDLFNEADIVVAHNGVAFDTKKAQARMIIHGMDPPSSFKEVDTLNLARRHFNFTSNKLGDLCETLGIGAKVSTGGFELWRDCLRGDRRAWDRMKKYNKQDVVILEELYLRLRPWSNRHPNLATMSGRYDACPKCGSTKGMKSQGWQYNAVTMYQRFRCRACGGEVAGRKLKRTETEYVSR